MGTPIYQVDAFTNQPFAGNPAGVCLLSGPTSEDWMQKVAREMNLSETAFLYEESDGYRLRWFTPLVEVDLCGHATLASAHILFTTGRVKPDQQARFYTRSGLLTAAWQEPWIQLNFPETPEQPAEAPQGLVEGLGCAPVYVGKNVFDYLVEVENEDTLRSLQPDFAWLKKLPARGLIVTSRSSSLDYDFVSRFFASPVGIDEDPVTGSAHSCLGPYWGKKLGKTKMMAYQASDRGGVLRVALEGGRVLLGGQAVTVISGELC